MQDMGIKEPRCEEVAHERRGPWSYPQGLFEEGVSCPGVLSEMALLRTGRSLAHAAASTLQASSFRGFGSGCRSSFAAIWRGNTSPCTRLREMSTKT